MSTLKLKKSKNKFEEFLKNLSDKYQINFIFAEFSGSGDSGEISTIEGHKIKDCDANISFTKDEKETLMQFFGKYLEDTGYDWYNNDGGQGDITLDLKSGEISCNIGINYMETEDHVLESKDFYKEYEI